MSSLVSFLILSKKDNIFDVEVKIVHPDEHNINDTPNFALQIILELYSNIKEGFIYNSGWSFYPFNKEESTKLILDENKALLDHLLELLRGKKMPIPKQEYERRQKDSDYLYQGENTSGMGASGEDYYLYLRPAYKVFCELAEKYIQKIEVVKTANYPHWQDTFEAWLDYQETWSFPQEAYDLHENTPAPTYHLQITVNSTNLGLLHHVQEKCFWDSAAYNIEWEDKNYVPKYEIIASKTLLYNSQKNNTKAIANEELVLLSWWNGLSDIWKGVLQKNLFLQCNLLPNSIINQYSGNYLNTFERFYPNKVFSEPNLQDLKNMCKMTALYASGCKLEDLSPLKMLTNLKILELEYSGITKITALKSLKKLQYLNIYSNEIPNLTPLKSLSKLRYLFVDVLSQKSLDVLANLKELRKLHFLCLKEIEINANFLVDLPNLKKISGSTFSLEEKSMPILQKLHQNGVEITWELQETGNTVVFE